jgi:hypothetical protein
MLSRALQVHHSLDKSKDREWIHVLLAFLKTYVDGLGAESLFPQGDKIISVDYLVQEMKKAASALDADLSHPDHPILTITVSAEARLAGDKDGAFLDVVVHNRLPCVSASNRS